MVAITADETDFAQIIEPFRREIIAHCYRMSGSHHDAEDLTQETFLRAWRGYPKFDHRSSVRTWLYKIATNTCLTALAGRQRRPLPTGLGTEPGDPVAALTTDTEVPWLEPFAGEAPAVTPGPDADPAHVVGSRESIRLAFIAALQHLPDRQRAVLILRDVLQWRAAEVAEAVGVSVATVNSLLQRARKQVAIVAPTEEAGASAIDDRQRRLLDRYVAAFEDYDIDAIVAMFTDRAVWEMPPFIGWYRGPVNIGALIATHCPAERRGDQILLPTTANAQPAFGLYMRGEDGEHHPFQLQVLELEPGGKVRHVVAFFDDDLVNTFARFGLPARPPSS